MNATHVHLMMTHIPVLGSAFGVGLLGWALWRKSAELKKVAMGVFVLASLLAVPVYLTGEPAEHQVKSLPGITKTVIEEHEEAAGAAFTGIVVLGLASLAGLILLRGGKPVPGWFGIPLISAALVVSGLMAWTANLGGQVRHTEIRAGAVAPAAGH